MGAVIGEVLPYAVVVAISPIQLIAVILMLLAPKARGTSIGFLIGWLVGLLVLTAAVVLLANGTGIGDGGDTTSSGGITLVLGVVLVVLALRKWRSRPAPGEDGALPGWMAAIETFTAVKALGLGFGLAFANPKNLILTVAAAVAIAGSVLTVGEQAAVVVVYALIAGSSVAAVVLSYLVAADRVRAPLDDLKVWLERNNAAVIAVVLLVMGAVLLGRGISGLSA